ncbi:YqjF family protein [Halobacillus litoralis]|uniref:YqjF family protein n=1 Tax=Halobacillus litoralis TaxID=45668 RepID=UPI001CFC8386|nr:DUF2071 domain-containing protein [Halobacillus litoralis]
MKRNHWIMHQDWEDLVFMHWPIPAKALRPFIPRALEIDEYDNTAWIAIVPFRMRNIRFRGLPPIPFNNELLELNVRTYVTYKGVPGVYFITLDANHPLGVFLARKAFGLPYVHAKMRMKQSDSHIHFTSCRTHNGYPPAHFHAGFQTISDPMHARPGSLLYWLTERYALWVVRGSSVYKGPILHSHWRLQKTEADISVNHLVDFLPPSIFKEEPITYYSKSLQTRIFPFEKQS